MIVSPFPLFAVESPSPLRAPEGKLWLHGWIAGLTDTGMRVRLRLGSATVFDCETGLPRPDVADLYSDLPGAAVSGFSLSVYVPPGLHIGHLEYQVNGATNWVTFHTQSIQAELSPLIAHLESDMPVLEPGKVWRIQGWCFHPQAEVEFLSIHFAHQKASLSHGQNRPDVGAQFPQFRTAQRAGFKGYLELEPGNGPVRLIAKLTNGSVVWMDLLPTLDIPNPRLAQAILRAARLRAASIKLPTCKNPEVSIIIPIYNQLDLTLGCLESLVRHAGPASFEVIIIDDKSAPQVPEVLSLVNHLRLIINETNQGFILNCNRGAQESQGRYVLFLNNDTEVTAGWLEAMLEVFRQNPRAGAVGAKLVYPDGRLQEAGGILWEDASGENFGKGDDPDCPEYNYLRHVDYCSGACLLVLRQLFLDLGGFDERYRPAYYEDADLAFAIRAAGHEVYYQPAARIIHYEGVSSGTDLRTGVKRHQAINQEKMHAKWSNVLKLHGVDSTLKDVARDRYALARILVIDACALTPDADSGSLRMFNLLLILARCGAKVTFAAENLQSYEPFSTQLRLAGVEHLCAPHTFNLAQYIEAHAYAFDVIILSRKHIAQKFIGLVRRAAPQARIVFDTVDLAFLRLERQAKHEQSADLETTAFRSREEELALCHQADLVFVVSHVEEELLARDVPHSKISLVSNIHEIYPSTTPFAGRRGLLFVGGYQHPPNVDAVDFLLDEVLPLIRRCSQELEVHIVGSNMPNGWQAITDPHIHLHGFVADLSPLYEKVRLAVAPLRYGAGVKGKVNQAMAHCVPVVATTMAVEGMYLVDGRDVLVADTAEDFARAVVRLHTDEALWQDIADGGLRNIKQHFSIAAVEAKLLTALWPEGLVCNRRPRSLPRRPAVPWPKDGKIGFGRLANARLYTREGWGDPEDASCRIVGSKAVIEMELPNGTTPELIKAIVYPFLVAPDLPRQRFGLSVNGRPLPGTYIECTRAEPTEVTWHIPSGWLHGNRRLTITFFSPDATAPRSLGVSSDERKLSFALLDLTLVLT